MAARRYELTVFKSNGLEIYGSKTTRGTLDYFIEKLEREYPGASARVIGKGKYRIEHSTYHYDLYRDVRSATTRVVAELKAVKS